MLCRAHGRAKTIVNARRQPPRLLILARITAAAAAFVAVTSVVDAAAVAPPEVQRGFDTLVRASGCGPA